MKIDKITLLLDSSRGQYIPRDFVQGFNLEKFHGISQQDIETCQNPENEFYWESWETILNNARYTENARIFTLHHDGDLWLLCIDEMSEEEKVNFFVEY